MTDRAVRLVPPLVAVALVVGLLAPVAVLAAEQGEYEPPVFTEARISLLEAVRITLEHEPTIKLRSEDSALQLGFAQEMRGAFDATLKGELNFEYTQERLTASELEREIKKRNDIQKDIDGLQADIDTLEGLLDEIEGAQADPLNAQFSNAELQAYLELINFLITNSTDPDDAADYTALRDSWLAEQRATISEELNDPGTGLYAELAGEQRRLARLGPLPHVRHDYEGSLTLQLEKPFRSGYVLTPFFEVDMSGSGYNGKKKAAELGGLGVIDTYNSRIGFEVDIPLGRGRGFESAGAQERAANIDYDASRAALTYAASQSVYNSIVAYWELVAAQETLASYEQSLALEAEVVELTNSLIEADEVPRAERPRVLARQAILQGQVEDARSSLHQARLTFASTIGLQVDDTDHAPLAADSFPVAESDELLAALPLVDMARGAVAHRYDYRAAKLLQESGKVLWRAATIDLKPRADMSLELSYAGAHEDGNIGEGLQGALWDKYAGPSAKVGLDLEAPIGNNTQRGKLAQSVADYRQKAITTRDLERTIKANVVEAAGSLLDAARRLEQSAAAVAAYREALASEKEKYSLGSSTLIDTILTEQRLTDAMLDLVSARKSYAQLLAKLRFESGTLVEEEEGGALIASSDLLTVPQPGQDL